MKPLDAHPQIARKVKTLQVLVGFLVAGAVGYLAYAHLKPLAEAGGGASGEVLGWVLLGFALADVLALLVVRAGMLRRARDAYSRKEIDEFCNRFASATIVSAALVEGVVFFAITLYRMHGGDLEIVVAAAGILVMLVLIPTRGRVDAMLEEVP